MVLPFLIRIYGFVCIKPQSCGSFQDMFAEPPHRSSVPGRILVDQMLQDNTIQYSPFLNISMTPFIIECVPNRLLNVRSKYYPFCNDNNVCVQYLHHGFGSGVDQEQRRSRCNGAAQQAEI